MSSIDELLEIMAKLRDPDSGCPWDRAQSFETIAPFTIEEAYEVAEAMELGDRRAMVDECGDLLFQVVFYAQLGQEEGSFDFAAIVRSICEKMIRRHPHVFVAEGESQTGETGWEAIKARECNDERLSVLDGLPAALPALSRALKMQRKAALVGFDWPEVRPVFDKIQEEIREIHAELNLGSDHERLQDEVGDLLFACVNLARHLQVDPEAALRQSQRKFEQRFRYIEQRLSAAGVSLDDAGLEQLEALWQQAKTASDRGQAES